MFRFCRTARVVIAPSLAIVLLAATSPVARAQQAAKLKWGPAALQGGAWRWEREGERLER